jgi:hypothetical protein
MTSTPGSRNPDREDDRSPESGSSQPDAGAGVELGTSDGTGGTFEPEEDPVEDVEADG